MTARLLLALPQENKILLSQRTHTSLSLALSLLCSASGREEQHFQLKSSQVTYVTMVPRVGNETLRPLGVATGNAFSVTRV